MGLVNTQWEFLQDVGLLINYASRLEGVQLSGGDLWQDNSWHKSYSRNNTPHLKTGQHPKRLAIDLNLFVDGEYIRGNHEVWHLLGEFWERLNAANRWGGNFSNVKDYNHFERFEDDLVQPLTLS